MYIHVYMYFSNCRIGVRYEDLLVLTVFISRPRPSVRLSVCLSVCPSVTFSFRTVTQKRIDVFSQNFAGTCTMSWGCAI